jgi:hypothetical protein
MAFLAQLFIGLIVLNTSSEYVFGFVYVHFVFTQGVPHQHILLWIENAPAVSGNMTDEQRQAVAEFCDGIMTCEMPDKLKSPKLHQLVKAYQVHECKKSHCMRATASTKTGIVHWRCKGSFPRPVST